MDARNRQGLLGERANLDLARVHNQACRVRKISNLLDDLQDKCECCGLPKNADRFPLCCPIMDLSELGVGFPLFFYFIKSILIIEFLAGVCVGIPCAYSNYITNNIPFVSSDAGSWYQSTFIQPGIKLPLWQTLLHSAFCILMIFYMFILKRYLRMKSSEFDYENTTPSDFTIWVKDLPYNYKPEDLKAFYETRGLKKQKLEIYDISPVYDIKFYVSQVRKLEISKGLLSYVEDYKRKYNKYPAAPCCASKGYSTKFLNYKIKEIENWLQMFETKHKNFFSQTNSAFVTFRQQSVAKSVAKRWKRSLCDHFLLFICSPLLCCCCCCYNSKKFKGKIVSVEKAPEPSDLIWENLSISKGPKYARRCFTLIFTLCILAVLCIAVFEVKSYQYSTKGSSNQNEDSAMKVKSISIVMSLLIIIVGRIIAVTVRMLSSFEKHISWTSYHKAVVNKLIFATSLNSIVVLLVVNIVTESMVPISIPGVDKTSETIYEQYGLASDLFWLLVTDAVVSPLTYILSPIYIAKLLKRRSIRKSAESGIIAISQKDANEIWENPPVDMAQRYANYMKTLLIVFVFAPIFPLVFFIGFLSMILQYWTDKTLLLRRHSRPPQLGTGLSDNMLKWMPILIAAYSISNLVTYTLLSSHSEDFLNYVPYGVIFLSLAYLLLPCKCFCFKSKKYRNDQDDFSEEVLRFLEDYKRSNPVTSKDAWNKWLMLVEEKKGRDERLHIETRLKEEEMISDADAVNKYAKTSLVDGRKSKNFSGAPISGSILHARNSTSILKTFARLSNPEYLPLPTISENPYTRQFTTK